MFGLTEAQAAEANKTILSAAAVRIWQEEFAAAHEMNGYVGLTMHPQFIGRRARLKMLDERLEWIRSFEGVWIATCCGVAEHMLKPGSGAGHRLIHQTRSAFRTGGELLGRPPNLRGPPSSAARS